METGKRIQETSGTVTNKAIDRDEAPTIRRPSRVTSRVSLDANRLVTTEDAVSYAWRNVWKQPIHGPRQKSPETYGPQTTRP